VTAPVPTELGTRLRLLQAGSATSAFDRFVVGPLLLSIAADFHVSLAAAAAVASWYFLCYGLSQPLWGLCSDRLGRVRTMRLTLAVAAVAGTASAFAPSLGVLVVLRACTGACVAAVVPAGLVYVGDVVPFARRQRTLTDLNAATAVGITLATALGGVLAAAVSWRVAFLVPALAAGTLAYALRALPEPPAHPVRQGGVGAVLRSRWGVGVLALALVEGAALLGLLTYLAPVLESGGLSPTYAGAVVALYGVGLLVSSRLVKRLASRTPPPLFLAFGAVCLAVAYGLVAVAQGVATVGIAALLIGAAFASMHSTMQAWGTEVVPQARAAMVSLFAGMLFVGSGIATALLGPLAGASRWLPLFGSGAVVAVLFGTAATLLRARYSSRPVPVADVPL
jgi:predicted MFS family arabinose efflux permease